MQILKRDFDNAQVMNVSTLVQLSIIFCTGDLNFDFP